MQEKTKQIIVEMPEELHRHLKAMAAMKCTTIKTYVVQAIANSIMIDEQHGK